jgi:hypothetical protein
MKTIVKVFLFSFLSLALIGLFQNSLYSNSSFTDFEGKWVSVDENISLDLDLFQTGEEIEGYHCSVTKHAQRIDCRLESDYMGFSIEGVVNGNKADVTFFSTYCNEYGKAKIVKCGDYLCWEVTEFPDGEFWLPLTAILKRVDK